MTKLKNGYLRELFFIKSKNIYNYEISCLYSVLLIVILSWLMESENNYKNNVYKRRCLESR